MTSQHGKMTGEFGAWLTNFIRGNDFGQSLDVYFDHGDKESFPNVVEIKGIYGNTVHRRNHLADIDVIVVNDKDEAILLIEIEESKSATSPKKLLGIIFAILCCNHAGVGVKNRQKIFKISPKTRLVVATHLRKRSGLPKKIDEVILPRLHQFMIPQDAIPIENISFVVEKTLMELLDNLKSKTKELLAS